MTIDAVAGDRRTRSPDRPWQLTGRLGRPVALAGLALVIAACGNSAGSGRTGRAKPAASGSTAKVSITLTARGCAPKPAKVQAGPVDFTVTNSSAGAVSEAELRSKDLAHILGEQENLTPGLSGGFSLTAAPGTYTVRCPGAAKERWTFTVTGKATGPDWQSVPALAAAVQGYGSYVRHNVAALVSHTQTFCTAIKSGRLTPAKVRYPQARVYYERIEPVAEIWGSLDTQIDGRWENPVTVAAQFMGFHKLEQLMWQDHTLTGAATVCAGLVGHEQQLQTLVDQAQYNPLEMASGATDLINEAATSKITGEEERYANTDLVVFKANVDAAMEVVRLLTPHLRASDPSLISLIDRRDKAVSSLLATYRASPGYDSTGYVEYTTVHASQRRALSTAVNALAEALSQMSRRVS